MNDWILQLNPNFFIDRGEPISFYQKGEEDWWGISRSFKQVKEGDTAYIWQSIDYRFHPRNPRGIYAKSIVISSPPHSQHHRMRIQELKVRDVGKWANHDEEQHQKLKLSLLVQYTDCYAMDPLTVDDLRIARLGHIGPLRFYHSEIYELAKLDALKIDALLSSK